MTNLFNDANFAQEVINASKVKPVLVDFFATWCGPCKMQAPIIEKVAEEMGDKAVIGKVNTEENQATSQEYGIMSIPTLIVFKDGQVKETLIGMQPKEILINTLKKYL